MLANVCFSERVSRFSTQQIIAILKKHEAGLWTAEVMPAARHLGCPSSGTRAVRAKYLGDETVA